MLRLTPTYGRSGATGTPPKLGWNRGAVMSAKTCNVSEMVQDYYTVIRSPSSAFQWSQNAWPWVTSKRDSRCFVLALAPDAPASTRLPCLAYINVPLSTYYKIWYVSKFTAASRGSPCDSTAFLSSLVFETPATLSSWIMIGLTRKHSQSQAHQHYGNVLLKTHPPQYPAGQ